jgi:biotin carboxylase
MEFDAANIKNNVQNKKCVLLLGASADQLFIIKTAHEIGLETAVLDGNAAAPGLKLGTYNAPINFSDLPKVADFVKQLQNQGINVCGVTTMGSDVPHLVAKIAKVFDWVGPSEETGRIATDKYEMKCRFLENNIPIPNFSLVNSGSEIINLWRRWQCSKVIVKPTDRAGSRGVRFLRNEVEAETAFQHALKNSLKGKVQLEEYIEGLQISTESILTKERCVTPGFADRVYEGMQMFWPQIMENGGWVPSILNTEMRGKVNDLVEKAGRALGIIEGPAKGDVVIHPTKGPMMIEIAARLSGGDFCESLVPLGTNVNYVEAALRIAVNETVNFEKLIPQKNLAVANRYFFPPPGVLEEIVGAEEIEVKPEVAKLKFFYQIGEQIPIIQNHGQRAGVAVIVSHERETTQKIVDEVYEKIKFKINGRYYSGDPRKYAGSQ